MTAPGRKLTVDHHRSSRMALTICCPNTDCYHEPFFAATACLDQPFHEDPAVNLRCARLRKSDRPKVDPFCMHDAEALIAAIHRDWGEAQGNYLCPGQSPSTGIITCSGGI